MTKTGRAVIVDHSHTMFGISAEISAILMESVFKHLKSPPKRIGLPNYPTPTSPALADHYYPQAYQIGNCVLELIGLTTNLKPCQDNRRLDQPDQTFQGPF